MKKIANKYSLQFLLESLENDAEPSLEDVYSVDTPSRSPVDHNKVVKDPALESWKVRNKKFFLQTANQEWFNKTFSFVHWFGHAGQVIESPIEQLEGTIKRLGNSDTWSYDNLSAFGFLKSEFDQIIQEHSKYGLLLKEVKIGYAAMTDMWTEEHWTLKDIVDGPGTKKHYMERYKSAMGIPKRPGLFDPKMAFKNQETYEAVINSPDFQGDPRIIPEVICDRWKLDKILIPKDSRLKESINKLLELHNYDVDELILEY